MSDPQTMVNDGAAYERLMGRWSQLVGTQFLDWLAPLPGLNWLDAGCGNGAFTEVLAARTAPARLTGIDPSDSQIAYAKARLPAALATFHTGDAQTLPFPDASFDAATMALAISFIPDPGKAVAELARVTKPGGWVSTYMWDLPGGGLPLTPLFRALAALGQPGAMPPSADSSRRAALEALWQGAGLTDIATEVIEIPVQFTDFDDFWASNTLTVGPQARSVAALPEQTRAELRQKLQASLPIAADGSITYTATANAVKGRRAG